MTFLQIDLPAMTLAILAGLTAALVGNLLILRRQALMGDALSHMVLPGIVCGYVISGLPKGWAIVGGALLAGLLGAGLISLIQRLGRLDAATAMGVVLTTMFAAGVLLIELINISGIHLDIEHALYGSLESVIWLYPVGWKDIFNPAGWADLPREIPFIAGTFFTLATAFFITAKEIRLVTFDPSFSATLGIPFWLTELLINCAVAIAVVAAFDAVGSILVISMLICPTATARLITNRFNLQIGVSLFIAAFSALLGYVFAVWGAPYLGSPGAVNAAGGIACVAGTILVSTSILHVLLQKRA